MSTSHPTLQPRQLLPSCSRYQGPKAQEQPLQLIASNLAWPTQALHVFQDQVLTEQMTVQITSCKQNHTRGYTEEIPWLQKHFSSARKHCRNFSHVSNSIYSVHRVKSTHRTVYFCPTIRKKTTAFNLSERRQYNILRFRDALRQWNKLFLEIYLVARANSCNDMHHPLSRIWLASQKRRKN